MTETRDLFAQLQLLGSRIAQLDLESFGPLTELEVMRVVSGKRAVCRAFWQQKLVFAKIFFGAKHDQYAVRDKQGVELLVNSNICTPPLLAVTKLASGNGSVLIYEAIDESLNAEQAYLSFPEKERMSLINSLVMTVAQHHKCGLVQTDCYLKNFLVKKDKVFTLDGDGIRQYSSLSPKQMLGNLCLLLSKIDVLDLENWYSSLIGNYLAINDFLKLNNKNIKPLIENYRIQASSSYADKKVFRQCTDVDVTKNANTKIAISRIYCNLVLPKTAAEADAYLNSDNMIKDGNTCTVFLAQISNVNVVVKRYNIKNFFHGVSRGLRQTRAAASWANAHRLKLLGLQTAHPIALIETKTFVFNRQAYYLAEFIDAPDMGAFFKHSTDKALRAKAVKELVKLMYRLYLLKLSHGDMKATNIKVMSDASPSLIDLDSMQQHKVSSLAQKAHVRDIIRFMQNWKDQPSLYNAFVKVFKVVYLDQTPLQAAKILK